ncbi:MAG: hypothetical protein HYV36_02340 [Lentisphaerae bacterium]|nr:hypothetical protein [Lentisphaerota bacterium]
MKTKRILAILGVIAAGCALVCVALFAWVLLSTKAGYWFQRQPIKRGFESIPGCTLISITGNEDVTLEHITAKVELEGKGTLILSELGPESFRQTGEMRLHQIGNIEMRQHSYGYGSAGLYITKAGKPKKFHGYAGWIDIGTQGPYADILPVKIQKVQDVIQHFDQILATLSKWPKEPEKLTVTAKDGTLYEASIVDVMSDKQEVRTTPPTVQ